MTTVIHDGASIAFAEGGDPDGVPIVLLHSLGSDRSMWTPQVAAFGDHRVVTINARGHGASTSPTDAVTLDDLGEDVIAVADGLGLDSFHVVGVSMGGQTALWLGINRPERVRTLTAANTAARIGSASGWEDRIAAVRTNGMAGLRDGVVGRWFSEGFADRHPDWHAAAGETFVRTDPDGYIACCRALRDADLRDSVASIERPTLVIGSTGDLSTPPEHAEWLHEHIGGSQLEIIDGAGHVSNLDRHERFTGRLRAFVGGR